MEQQHTSLWPSALLAVLHLWGEDVAHDRQLRRGEVGHAWTRERHTVRAVALLVALLARRRSD